VLGGVAVGSGFEPQFDLEVVFAEILILYIKIFERCHMQNISLEVIANLARTMWLRMTRLNIQYMSYLVS
jgi:hypothetical protein